MSLLIKGIGIPKSCGRCWFNNSSISCAITGSCIDRDDENRERLDDCPLVDLGKHGWLIDFDALIEKYWDGNSMMITEWDLKDIKAVIEAEDGE